MGLESATIYDGLIVKQQQSFSEAYEIAYAHHAPKEVNSSNEPSQPQQTFKLGCTPVKTKNNKPDAIFPNKGKCYGCNGNHSRNNCKFKNSKCFACGKIAFYK